MAGVGIKRRRPCLIRKWRSRLGFVWRSDRPCPGGLVRKFPPPVRRPRVHGYRDRGRTGTDVLPPLFCYMIVRRLRTGAIGNFRGDNRSPAGSPSPVRRTASAGPEGRFHLVTSRGLMAVRPPQHRAASPSDSTTGGHPSPPALHRRRRSSCGLGPIPQAGYGRCSGRRNREP